MDDRPILVVMSSAEERSADSERLLGRATEIARERDSALVLYDLGATGSIFESPLPTAWSAEGEEEAIPPTLDADDLEALGGAKLAERLRALEGSGVRARAWLPENDSVDHLAVYTARIGAATILTIDGIGPDREALEKADLPVEEVDVAT